LGGPGLEEVVLKYSPACATDCGSRAVNVDIMDRAEGLDDPALRIVPEIGDDVQSAVGGSGPTGGRIRDPGRIYVLDLFDQCARGNIVGHARQEPAVVHRPGPV